MPLIRYLSSVFNQELNESFREAPLILNNNSKVVLSAPGLLLLLHAAISAEIHELSYRHTQQARTVAGKLNLYELIIHLNQYL
jgi:hypothetical protein